LIVRYIEFIGREIDTAPDLDTQSTNNTAKSENKNNSKTTKKKAVVVGIGMCMINLFTYIRI
jgi:hypothetical protein